VNRRTRLSILTVTAGQRNPLFTDRSDSELLGVERGDPGVPVDVRQVVRGSRDSRIVGLGPAGD
jgi:hypothetical protein